jgi:hypothetical protein
MEIEWLSLLRGELSLEEAGPMLSRTAADLKAFLDAQPLAEQRILSIVGKRLEGPLSAKSLETLDASLASYLGRERAHLVMWAIEPDQSERMGELEKHAASQVMDLLRTISSLYRPELINASEIADRLPDDWRIINREVFYDQIVEHHRLKFRIEKFSGEEVKIEGSASSLLTLTSYLIRSVRLVGTRDAFDEKSIELFLDEAGQLQSLLQISVEDVPAEGVSAEEVSVQ